MKRKIVLTTAGMLLAFALFGTDAKNLLGEKWSLDASNTGRLTREESIFVCSNEKKEQKTIFRQMVKLNQKFPEAIKFSAESKADGVMGKPEWNYCIYLDIVFSDGSKKFGVTIPFKSGSHNWEKIEGSFTPEKNISAVFYNIFFQNVSGKAEFRNFLLEEAE